MNKFLKILRSSAKGSMLLFVMIFGFVAFMVVVIGISSYAISESAASRFKKNYEQAFQIAEAGISYYRSYLAAHPGDFQDGTGTTGPYVHNYLNSSGSVIGHFSLQITPPSGGSTIVTIVSTGWLDAQPASKRKIKVKLGYPSFSDYAVLTNSGLIFEAGQSVHGKIHSNDGIKFNGTGDAPVTSAKDQFTCLYNWFGTPCEGDPQKPGIFSGIGNTSTLWEFPAAPIDFSVIGSKLAQIKSDVLASGVGYFAPSGAGNKGWRLQFLSNGTYNASVVTGCVSHAGQDVDYSGGVYTYTNVNPCLDAATFGVPTNYSIPPNGEIYVDDNVWVDGTVAGRVTVGGGVGKNIIINGDLLYATQNGSSELGLISDQNIYIPFSSTDILHINGALMAQNGGVKRLNYASDTKSSLTFQGAIISYDPWIWTWYTSGLPTSGYMTSVLSYDQNLTMNPLPGFSINNNYQLIYWQEIMAASTVVNVPVTSITVSPSPVSMVTNDSVTLSATILPSDATDKGVSWQILGNPHGTLSAGSGSSVTYTAGGSTSNEVVRATSMADNTKYFDIAIDITASSIPVSNVDVVPSVYTIPLNGLQNLTAIITPSDATNQAVVWGLNSGGGSLGSAGLTAAYTAPGSPTIAYITVTSSDNISKYKNVTINVVNQSPTIATAAASNPGTVNTGTTAVLSALGADDGGESNLTYSWSVISRPSGAIPGDDPTFSPNGNNAAKNSTATFKRSGTYGFRVTITDTGGKTVTSDTSTVVNQVLTRVDISPMSASVQTDGNLTFTATSSDQFGRSMAGNPSYTWTANYGTISGGNYTAPAVLPGGGQDTVMASSGGVNSLGATVNITSPGSGIALDSGFPVVKSAGSVSSNVITPVFSTAGPGRLIVVSVAWANFDAVNPTVSGAGLTWTLAVKSNASGKAYGSRIFTAWADSQITGQALTIGGLTSFLGSGDIVISIYSLSGTQQTIGDTFSKDSGSTSSSFDATITASAAGSWIIGAFAKGSSGDFAALANTNPFDTSRTNLFFGAVVKTGRLITPESTTGPGDVTIGTGGSGTKVGTAAIEVLQGP